MKTFLLFACLLLHNVDLSYAFGVSSYNLNSRRNAAGTRLYTVIDVDEPSDSPIPTLIQDGSTAEEAEAVRLERLRAADEAAKQFKSNLHEAVEELKTKGSDVNVNVNVKDETTKKSAPTPFGELLRGATTRSSSNNNKNNNEEISIQGADTQNSVDEYDHTLLRTQLKSKLYQLSASYDRGFGATPKARQEVNDIIEQLSELNPTQNSARGINGDSANNEEEEDDDDVPLKGIWRMIWTSAYDVVSLGASPISTTSAIYQDIRNPPVAINIIDFIPKTQSILPSALSPSSLLRAEVATRASSRNVPTNDRVGLIFEGVKLQPIELFGQKVDNLPPLTIDFKWQRNLVEKLIDFVPGIDKGTLGFSDDDGGDDVDANAPGYFDILYVDDELLVISQQAPGGIFALVKVDSCEP